MESKAHVNDKLYQTAIHEAGHAVITILLGGKFKSVSIRKYRESLGRVQPWSLKTQLIPQLQGWHNGAGWSEKRLHQVVTREICILYAGYLSQLETGINNKEGAAQDFEQIGNMALSYKGDDKERDVFLTTCYATTESLVKNNWQKILRLARHLIIHNKLTGKEVILLLQ